MLIDIYKNIREDILNGFKIESRYHFLTDKLPREITKYK